MCLAWSEWAKANSPLVRGSSNPVPMALDAVTVHVPRRPVTVLARVASEVVLRTRFRCLLATSR